MLRYYEYDYGMCDVVDKKCSIYESVGRPETAATKRNCYNNGCHVMAAIITIINASIHIHEHT